MDLAHEDRLSNLPDDVIHRILSFLDMTYAVQASTLSQRWKLIWTSIRHLNLSSNQFRTLPKFAKFVKYVLSHRDNLTEVSAVDLYFTGAATQFFLRSIINYACSHNVKKMTITYFPKNFQEFPLLLFSHRTLKHLSLTAYHSCCTIPKSAWDFPALETLHLNNITFCENTDKNLDLFSKCVNLKNLSIHNYFMKGLEVFNVCAPQLSNLTIICSFEDPEVFNVVAPQLDNLTVSVCSNKYVVSAPRLSSITCNGCGPLQLSTDGFCSLEKVNLNLSMFSYNKEKDVPVLLDLLQKLGSAKFLTLHADIVEALSSCLDRLSHEPCPFDNLKCLRIDALKSEEDHKATISTQVRNYFLENSPHATVIIDLPVEKPKKPRKWVRNLAEVKRMLDASKQAQSELIAKLDAILKAKHLQLRGLMLQIINNTIEELQVCIEGGVPNYENILSTACYVRSKMDKTLFDNILCEGDRIDMEAQFFSQYEALKRMLDTRIDSSQWAKIDKTLFDNIHQPPTSSSSAKDMPTSSSVASASRSKSVVQPSHNSLS